MAEVGGMGDAELALRSVVWAVTHTKLSRRSVQRRVTAWLDGDRSPYALKGGKRNSWRGDRLVDPVDAERVRLQAVGRLSAEVTAVEWSGMVARREIPWLYVTQEQWFRDVVGAAPQG